MVCHNMLNRDIDTNAVSPIKSDIKQICKACKMLLLIGLFVWKNIVIFMKCVYYT